MKSPAFFFLKPTYGSLNREEADEEHYTVNKKQPSDAKQSQKV